MSSIRSVPLPSFRRLCKTELGIINDIQLDAARVTRFLGPIPDIIAAVRHGPAHAMVTIEAAEGTVGFYVVHPDRRDRACWWLGWLAVDCRQEGLGYGRAAILAAITQMARIPGCRRIRLLVAPDNSRAISLYARAGFRAVGCLAATGEIVLEAQTPASSDAAELAAFNLQAVTARARRVFRHRRLRLSAGPHAAWVIGVERGPPRPSRDRVQLRPLPASTAPACSTACSEWGAPPWRRCRRCGGPEAPRPGRARYGCGGRHQPVATPNLRRGL